MIKKYLGQNFLKNKKIFDEIVRIGEVSKEDTVLEVGPGHGELTELLAKMAKKVIAVEKDKDLIPLLREKFSSNKRVKIIHEDILEFENLKLQITNYKIVANIPYYITSRFLRTYLSDTRCRPLMIVLTVQYEVAKRISAKPPDMNLLALSAQAYGKVEFVRKVSRGNFSPAPKVDSAIIKISEISDKFFRKNRVKEKKFFEILRQAFQQKRKMLRHSLSPKFDFKELRSRISENFGTKRPEELSLEDWLQNPVLFQALPSKGFLKARVLIIVFIITQAPKAITNPITADTRILLPLVIFSSEPPEVSQKNPAARRATTKSGVAMPQSRRSIILCARVYRSQTWQG